MQVKLKEFFNYKPIFSEEEVDKFFEKEVKLKVKDYL
jgi:hypothetical protein